MAKVAHKAGASKVGAPPRGGLTKARSSVLPPARNPQQASSISAKSGSMLKSVGR